MVGDDFPVGRERVVVGVIKMSQHLADARRHPGFNAPKTEVERGNHQGFIVLRMFFNPALHFPFHDPPQGVSFPAAHHASSLRQPLASENLFEPIHSNLHRKILSVMAANIFNFKHISANLAPPWQ